MIKNIILNIVVVALVGTFMMSDAGFVGIAPELVDVSMHGCR